VVSVRYAHIADMAHINHCNHELCMRPLIVGKEYCKQHRAPKVDL